jgi:signal transduction histidine kinase/CheY-like chemotaxis protein
MIASIHVLLLEDNQSDAELLTVELAQTGYQVTWDRVDNREAYLAYLNNTYDIILADHMLPKFDGRQALALLQEKGWDIPFIVVTGSIGEEQAAEYIKLGAADYLLKDRLQRLGSAITQALEQRQLRREKQRAEEQLHQTYNRLERLVAELQATNQRLTEEIEERRQAQQALQRQTEQAQALAEISRIIAESRAGYQAALETITQRLAELIGDACIIRLLSEDGLWLQPASIYHPEPQAAALLNTILATPQRLGEGVVGQALHDGQALFLNEIDQTEFQQHLKPEHQPWMTNFGVYALLVIPLKVQGQIIGALSLSRDTADRPYKEEDRRFAQELADRAAIAIDNARMQEAIRYHTAELEQRVTERTADLEAFTYSVSHDLRAPLRAISGFSQILARRHHESLNEEGRHYLDNVVRASAQMSNLINDLLAYSRLGHQGLKDEEVSLATLLQQVSTNLAPKITTTQATINIADDLPVISSNRTLLGEIFTNLIDNSLTYCQSDRLPTVSISYCLQANQHHFSVADNGIGIPPEYQERIFQAFQRLHSAEEYPGTGIGLAIVKKSVELLGGQVGVESQVGTGTTFWFTIPQKPPARSL